MSDMKRAAASLVARRSESFESHHGIEASKHRLEAALDRAGIRRPWPFLERWSEREGRVVLDVTYEPSPRAQRFLKLSSIAFVALVWASAWALMKSESAALRFLLPLVTVLAILGFPMVSLALASNRDALESRIRRAIRVALVDADEKFPPAQRWADEKD
jgi:hypothetical protein